MTPTSRDRQADRRIARPGRPPRIDASERETEPIRTRQTQQIRRQKQGVPNRPVLSPEARRAKEAARREAIERAREEKLRQKALRRLRRRRLFVLSSVFALVIVAIYYVVLFAGLGKTQAPKDAYPVQIFRAGEKDALETLSVEETLFNGNTYLPLSVLQRFVTVTQYGDHARRSLSFSGGDIATFDLGTPNCEINGVRMSLEAPVLLKDEVLYLPVDFFFRRMNCFEYTYSSPLKANVLTFLPELSPALVPQAMSITPRIDPNTVPAVTAAPAA